MILLGNQRGNLSGGTIGTLAGMVLGVVLLVAFPPAGGITFAAVAAAASIGGAVGGLAGTLVDTLTAADQINRAPEVGNIQIQTSTYGTPIPQIFGEYRTAGNIVWMGPKQVIEQRDTADKKGKGKGPTNTTVINTYAVDLAIALCDTQISGPMTGIRHVFADGTLIYNEADGMPFPATWTFYRGDAEQPIDPIVSLGAPGFAPGWPFLCYIVMGEYNMGNFPRVPNFTFVLYQSGGIQLKDAVDRLLDAAKIPAAQRNVADLPDEQTRFFLASVAPVRSAIEQLQVAYRFVLLESGLSVIGKSLNLDPFVADILETELDAVDREDQHSIGLEIQRERTRGLPTSITLSYPSRFRDFQASTQTAMFNDVQRTETSRSVSTIVALDDAQAKALVQETLDRIWVERTAFHFSLGRQWARLEAGDRINVQSRNATYAMTIAEVSYTRPGIIEVRARSDSAPVMFVEGALPGIGDYQRPVLNYVEQTQLYFLELPALSNEDQEPRTHVAYSYVAAEGWPGASLHRSVDAGESYQLVHVGSTRLIGGTCSTVLPHVPWWLTDTTSVLTIVLEYGSLHSVTPAQFQAGAIPLMIGQELVQVRDCELIAPMTYELRHFWRGRRGTSWATGTHAAGERVTLLDSAIYRIPQPLTDRFVTRLWKPVTRSLTIDTAPEYSYAMVSENLKPWSVATLHVEQSNDDWLLSWRGRARFLGSFVDGSEAAPDVDFLNYRIQIYSDGTGATIIRQIDLAHTGNHQVRQLYTYDEAQQIADFGSAQSVLYAQVFQVGRTDISRPGAA